MLWWLLHLRWRILLWRCRWILRRILLWLLIGLLLLRILRRSLVRRVLLLIGSRILLVRRILRGLPWILLAILPILWLRRGISGDRLAICHHSAHDHADRGYQEEKPAKAEAKAKAGG